MQKVAVWKTAARSHLNNHNPIWIRDLAHVTFLKQIGSTNTSDQ